LNWRILHPLQAVLVAVASSFLIRKNRSHSTVLPLIEGLAVLFLFLGVSGTIYDAVTLRFPNSQLYGDHPKLAARSQLASQLIESESFPASRIQYNPRGNPYWQMYLNRPVPIADEGTNSSLFGIPKHEHAKVIGEISSIFSRSLAPSDRAKLINRYQIDFLLIQKEDDVFAMQSSELFDILPPIVVTSEDWLLVDTRELAHACLETERPKPQD
jgi:hypothetical protein